MKCLTTGSFIKGCSICLVDQEDCKHSYEFGFSKLCNNPDRKSFHSDEHTPTELQFLADHLRHKRREAFWNNLDSFGKSFLKDSISH